MFTSLKPPHWMNRRVGYFPFQTHGFERRPKNLRGPLLILVRKIQAFPPDFHTSLIHTNAHFPLQLGPNCYMFKGVGKTHSSAYNQNKASFTI